MLDKLLRVKASYVFNTLAIGLMIIVTILFSIFENTKDKIVNINNSANLEYVTSLADNLTKDIKHVMNKDFLDVIQSDPIIKEYIESDLKLFITTKYKHIYLLAKDNTLKSNIVLLADGSSDTNDNKFSWIYNDLDKKKYLEVYDSKKPIYFKHSDIEGIGATYIKPILVDDVVEAIIAVDFSLQEQNTIYSELQALKDMFGIVMLFSIIVFFFILWFSYIDKKRENEKNRAFDKLKYLNSVLEQKTLEIAKHSDELSYLNGTLEERVVVEVEKNREKDKQLIQQSRLAQMGEMLSMIAHQWRQPLSAISSTMVSLRIKAELGKSNSDMVITASKNIAKYTEHLSDTIDDFRDFFRPDKNGETTNYNELVKSVLSIVEVSLRTKNIELILDLNCEDEFHSFSNELKQVILNLIKNAEDALLDNEIVNPYIKISTYRVENDGLKFILEVSDNAGGIALDIIDKIFDPYFSTKLEKNGSGLGLYMSKTIIEEHCVGKLQVQNSSEGAVFKISLGDNL